MCNKLVCGHCRNMICLPLDKITKVDEAINITIESIKQHLAEGKKQDMAV